MHTTILILSPGLDKPFLDINLAKLFYSFIRMEHVLEQSFQYLINCKKKYFKSWVSRAKKLKIDRQTNKIKTVRQADKKYRQTDKKQTAQIDKDSQTSRQKQRQTDRQKNRQTERQTKTDRQRTDRQTDKRVQGENTSWG